MTSIDQRRTAAGAGGHWREPRRRGLAIPGLALALALALTPMGCARRSGAPAAASRLAPVAARTADAQEMLYHNAPGEVPRYAERLEDLLPFDESLTDEPGVTFLFGPADADGYQFTVTRPGDASVACNVDDGCRPLP